MIVIMMVGVGCVMMIDANYHCDQFCDALRNHLSSALLTVQRSLLYQIFLLYINQQPKTDRQYVYIMMESI